MSGAQSLDYQAERPRANVDAVPHHIVSGNAQIVLVQLASLDSRQPLHGGTHVNLPGW